MYVPHAQSAYCWRYGCPSVLSTGTMQSLVRSEEPPHARWGQRKANPAAARPLVKNRYCTLAWLPLSSCFLHVHITYTRQRVSQGLQGDTGARGETCLWHVPCK